MRLIKNNELKKASKLYAEIFKDYAAYDVFFKRNKLQKKKIFYFYRYEVFSSANYTYVSDDFKLICSIKRPGDTDRNPMVLFKNPLFAVKFCLLTGAKAIKLAKEYISFSEKIAEKYYNPETDCYIKNIGVDVSLRGQGKLKEMINEVCTNKPIVLETHSEENVAIYKKLGFKICKATQWHGVTHYFMKRAER